jgi:hypothetical protein
MRTTLSLLFSLRKPKNYQSGEMPIYLRITVDGQRTELAVSRKCDPERWDALAGRAIGSNANAKALNAYLDDVQFKIYELQRRMSDSDELITAETVKNRFVGKVGVSEICYTLFRGKLTTCFAGKEMQHML